MRRQYLPIEELPIWTQLNGIHLSGVAFCRLQADDRVDRGCAVVATEDRTADGPGSQAGTDILMEIPSDLLLSFEAVNNYAKSDWCLREVLEAVQDFGKTARRAILIFLLIQISRSSPDFSDERQKIGVSNPWTEYVKFMPQEVLLPTFYLDEELELLRGTSLKPAVDAKNVVLRQEFEHIRLSTERIPWCHKYWWDEETGKLTLDDWKYVDAIYRSRMMDLPGHGHSMVPCADIANHASGNKVRALFDTDKDGNAVLQLRAGKELHAGEEVTISYGDEKPASEMIFSYGFLEEDRSDAKEMFLELDVPDDDPLKSAKRAFDKTRAGIRLRGTTASSEGNCTSWESPLVWWACINEEDGLDFKVLQRNDGTKELKAAWKDENIETSNHLKGILQADPLWDVFQLRATVLILERLEAQLAVHREMERIISDVRRDETALCGITRPSIFNTISRLRDLEARLLENSVKDLTKKKHDLLISAVVTSYLNQQSEGEVEEFS